MGLITRFDAGPSPLNRMHGMKSFVMDYYQDGGNGEGALVELVQSHPIAMLQLGILFICMLNTLLQGLVSSKFGAAMRKQSIILGICSAALDIFAHMNTVPGAGDMKGSASSASDASDNPFASLMKGMVPSMPKDMTAKKSEEGGEGDKSSKKEEEVDDGKPEEIDEEYLSRARSDMKNLSKGRAGQVLAYAVIAFMCGSKKHCVVPLLLRNFPFMIRGALIIIALLAPDLALPMVLYSKTHDDEHRDDNEETEDKKEASRKKSTKKSKGHKKKSYRQGNRGKLEIGGIDVSSLVFPVDMCAPGGDMLQDFFDLLAWPVEQMILSGWMKQLTSSIFGSGAGGGKTKKLFGIPVGAKDTGNRKAKGSPAKMSKYPGGGTSTEAANGDTTSSAAPVNMFQIGFFASKALCIYNYQRIRSKGIRQLESLPRLVKALNIPGGEALLAGFTNQGANGGDAEGSDDGSGNGDGSGTPPSADNDDSGGDGGTGGVRVLPSAKTRHSDTPVPVTAAIKVTREDLNEPAEGKPDEKKKKKKRKKRGPIAAKAASAETAT